jgi:hypothetical protein
LIGKRDEYGKAKTNFLAGITEFGNRLQGKEFHGGALPDEADFLVQNSLDYAVIWCPKSKVQLPYVLTVH